MELEKMRVDVIEGGFAAASPGDFEAIHAVATAVKDSTICSLARAQAGDIQKAGEAIKPAARGRIHTFIATSPIHMQHKLRMSPDQVLVAAVDAVKFARSFCDDVEFSAEDAVRSEMDFLCRVFEAVIDAGARTINVPDTVEGSVSLLRSASMTGSTCGVTGAVAGVTAGVAGVGAVAAAAAGAVGL